MKKMQQFVLVLSLLSAVLCSPFDDGKYKPRTYDEYDDGKYYRPLDEGKYIPGDEGKYTYIYKQGNWPYDGTYGTREGENDPYMGYKIYASRYPYVHGVIKGLISKYVSSNNVNFGEATEGSTNHYSKVYADKEVAVKCKYIMPDSNASEFTTQYPPHMTLSKDEKLGSFYSFKGTKVLSTVSNALTNKLKLQYEVFVRVVDDVSSPLDSDTVTPTSDEMKSPLIILKPSSFTKAESMPSKEVKNSISEIVKSLIIDDVLPTVGGVQSSTVENLRLTIGDVPLLANDDVKPTIPYVQSLDVDEIKPTSNGIVTLIQEDVKPTTDGKVTVIQDNVIPTIDSVVTLTEENVNPSTDGVVILIQDNIKPVTDSIETLTQENVNLITDSIVTFSEDNVKPIPVDSVLTLVQDKPSTDSVVALIQENIKPSTDNVVTLSQENINPETDSVVPLIHENIKPSTDNVVTLIQGNINPSTDSVVTLIHENEKTSTDSVVTLIQENVKPTNADSQFLLDASVTTSSLQSLTEAEQR